MRVIAWIKSEPALILGALQAALALGSEFGLKLTGTQEASLVAFVAAIFAVICRQVVTPVASLPSPSPPPAAGTRS